MSAAALRFALLLISGFLAAAATGKLVPHARWIAETWDVSLGLAGFAISAVMLPGAVLSAGVGVITDRVGAKAMAIGGLVIGGVASLLLGHVSGFGPLVAVRLVEGIGYSLLVIAATVLVVEVTSEPRRTLALAVWSSFAPVGFAMGQWAASAAEGADRLVGIGHWHGTALLGVALAVWLGVPRRVVPEELARPRGRLRDGLRHRPALMASLAFGCVTGVLLAAVAVTPIVLAGVTGMTVGEAAGLTALAALPGIIGRLAAGWLLGLRVTPRAVLAVAGAAGVVTIALVLAARLPLLPALGLFTVFQVLMGIIPGVLSAMIPLVAPSREQVGTVSGMVNQMVTLGNLIGPPLVLSVYAIADAAGAALMLAAWTLLCVAFVVRLPVFSRPVG